jgi:hypothetical protein
MLNCPYYDSTHIFESINNSNNLNKLQIKMKLEMFFHRQYWLFKSNSFFSLTWNVLWFGLLQMPMAYLSFHFNLEKGMKIWKNHEPIKWTIKVME